MSKSKLATAPPRLMPSYDPREHREYELFCATGNEIA